MTAIRVQIDSAEWRRGFQDAAAGLPAKPGADGYSYFSGRVEGEAARLRGAGSAGGSSPSIGNGA